MDDRATGEIQRPASDGILRAVGQKTAVPDPVTQGKINQRSPKDRERNHGAELHSLGKCTTDKCGRDNKEHALEEHVRKAWNDAFHRRSWSLGSVVELPLYAFHEQKVGVTDVR